MLLFNKANFFCGLLIYEDLYVKKVVWIKKDATNTDVWSYDVDTFNSIIDIIQE